MTARELLDFVDGQWSVSPRAVLDAADDHRADLRARARCPEDAETCRQAMLAAVRLANWQAAAAWRAWAQLRFSAVGWMEGVAAISMLELYRVLAADNNGYAAGRTLDVLEASGESDAVLDAIEPFAAAGERPYDFGPDGTLIARFVCEKRAALALIRDDKEQAAALLDRALAHTADEPRGEIKVLLAIELVRYLADSDALLAIERTESLRADAAWLGDRMLTDNASANLEAMRAATGKLLLYETL